MTSSGTSPESKGPKWVYLRCKAAVGRLDELLRRIPRRLRIALHELPWLIGIGLAWRVVWRDGDALVLDGRVTGYQWADYMNNCWLVAHRHTERYDSWRGIVHAGFCGAAGEALESYPNGAILLASICVLLLIFAAGLLARSLAGPWAGFFAAVTLSWLPTVAQAAHWGNSTPLIAAGTALALAFGAAAMRWPRMILATAAGAAACLAWAVDKRGLLVVPGVCGMIVVASLFAPSAKVDGAEGQNEKGRMGRWFAERMAGRFRLPKPMEKTWTFGWRHRRKFALIPAFALGLLVFPLRTAWLGETTNVEWERHMDAESMRQVHDGTAQRWTQQARRSRVWSTWGSTESTSGGWIPPYSAVFPRSTGSLGLDEDLRDRCSGLEENQFLVIPDFFYTDCARATLAHNTREKLPQLTALPLGLLWLSLPLCLLPARRGWKGVFSGGALLAAVGSMWLVMASLNVMPTRYLIQFAVGTSILIPVGVGRLVHTVMPRALGWFVGGLCCIGLCIWAQALDVNDRRSIHTWSYNEGFLDDYYEITQTVRSHLGEDDDFLDCSDKGINIWLLPEYTRFGTPMLKVDDAGRCMQWIDWAPTSATRWLTISPGKLIRPQGDPGASPMSLEPVLRAHPSWSLVIDDRGSGLQLWKRTQ